MTGGIGSGKTEFCNELSRLGAHVVNADLLARELMNSDPELISSIKQAFGDESYLSDGRLNRAYLSQQAFQEGGVERLNEIVHPRVKIETDKLRNEADQQGVKVFVKEAALLLLNGRPSEYDKIILVKANQESRIERIQHRDQMSVDEILARIAKQQSDAELEAFADIIIQNNGTLEQLQQEARQFYESLVMN